MRTMKSFPECPELVFSFFQAMIGFTGFTKMTVAKDQPREIQVSKCALSLFRAKKPLSSRIIYYDSKLQ